MRARFSRVRRPAALKSRTSSAPVVPAFTSSVLVWPNGTVSADEEEVDADDRRYDEREDDRVQHEDLTGVHRVEDRADAGGVHRVLCLGGDPLRIPVGLQQEARQTGEDAGGKKQGADHPGE